MSVADELRRVRMRAVRAVLVRVDAGRGFAEGRTPGDVFLRDPRDRELLGRDPLRPSGGQGKALARIDAELAGDTTGGILAALSERLAVDDAGGDVIATVAAAALDPDTLDLCRSLAGGRATGVRVDVVAELWGRPVSEVVLAVESLVDRGLVLAPGEGALLGRSLELAPNVVAWLAGARRLPARLAIVAELSTGASKDTWVPDELAGRAAELAGARGVIVRGPPGVGKRALARRIAHADGKGLLASDVIAVLASPAPVELCRELVIEAQLRDAWLYLAGCERLDDDAGWTARALLQELARTGLPLILATRDPSLTVAIDRELVAVSLARPSLDGRVRSWQVSLDHAGLDLGSGAARELAEHYVVGPGTVAEVVREAARQPSPKRASIDAAIGSKLAIRLGSFGALVSRRAQLGDLVVPDEVRESMLDMLAMVRERGRILERWGYAEHLGLSRGVSALFLGSPGTGKTMAASAIAGELGLPLFRIDLAAVVSKWIGETEKHLSRIFDEAQSAQALLLFDEADSLFGKRTEVQTANDRYANVEINYLLQRMETFDGITVLTSNLESGIDPAFMRRLNFRIRFPDPDSDERAALWRALLPPDAAIEGSPDFEELGDAFEMTGGHIRNAIVRAAVVAARDDRAITAADLVEGARHEYFELGKLVPGRR